MSPVELVREFHETFGVPIGTKPNLEGKRLRRALLGEEYHELIVAIEGGDPVEVAHEMADLVYVVYGSALTFGIDLDAVLAEVHRANMSKVDEDGKAIFNSDGKVLKGPNFTPADVASVVSR